MRAVLLHPMVVFILVSCGSLFADTSDECDLSCEASRSVGKLLAIELKANEAFNGMYFDADEIHSGIKSIFEGKGISNPPKKRLLDDIEKYRGSQAEEDPSGKFLEVLQSSTEPNLICESAEGSVSQKTKFQYDYFYLPVDGPGTKQSQLDLISAHTGFYIPPHSAGADESSAPLSSNVTVAFREVTVSLNKKGTGLASCVGTEAGGGQIKFYLNSSERWQVKRFPLRGVIRGWRDALTAMLENEVGILAVGPSNAYGEYDSEEETDILIHQIALLKVH